MVRAPALGKVAAPFLVLVVVRVGLGAAPQLVYAL